MSDNNNRPQANGAKGKVEAFKPMDLSALDTFDEELSVKNPETEPDFDRFKLLFNPDELEKEDISFEALNTGIQEAEEEVFEPLIEGTGAGEIDSDHPVSSESDPGQTDPPQAPPEKSPEEQGFEQGFEKGMAQGLEEGRTAGETKGFEDGFAKGQAQGIEEGRQEGMTQGIEEGREQGRTQGLEDARAEVSAQAEEILAPLKESLETADQLLDRMLGRYEGQIIELVHKIAGKVVGATVATDDEVVRHAILEALKTLVAPEEITLNVSTEDYEYVEMVKEVFFESMGSLNHIAVNSDPMIPKGGCRIESAGAVISTDPESKLAAVYDAVVEASRP